MVGRPLWERKVPSSSLGAPMFPMNTISHSLPSWTFTHRPDRDYTLRGDGMKHSIVSVAYQTPADFQSLVLSVAYHPRPQEWLQTEVQICQGGEWSKFFKLAFYSPEEKYSFDEQSDEAAALHVDVLRAARPAQAYRFRLTLCGQADIPEVTVCVQPSQREIDPRAAILPAGHRQVALTPVSQMQLAVPEPQRRRMCSPTSLCMALNALGVASDPLEVAREVYDTHAQIYGNWTLNVAYACARGLEACVTQFKRLSQLEDYLTPDSLILASIGYGPGELTEAAIAQTAGHLVLVCGWEQGLVRVADPAAPTAAEVLRFYHAHEFARVWLVNKAGAAYLVRKK